MQKKIYGMFKISCLCLWSLSGVFGVDSVKSVSVTEGDLVHLNSDLTEIQRDDEMTWKFNNIMIAKLKDSKSRFYEDNAEGRFRDRLKLDQTGSLIITNTRITHSGEYTVIGTSTDSTLNIFRLTVYAPVPVPVITRDSSQNSSSSSSSSSSNCSLLCSVLNVSDVTLSWYKGNSLLSSISVSDLSRSLSLNLEYLDDFYSCVVNNPIRNQTTHLNTELCQTCSDPPDSVSLIVWICVIAAAGFLLIVTTVGIFFICRKHRKTDQEVQTGDREITYADPTFYKRHKSRATEQDNVVYAGVSRR
ncbi:hepatocyte cell adhesion molecule isoform X3 [Carassius gibelio]|uniref:hepatocyte cell adhesion molecule isoform X3 n=1 Tax=Carassius gibelio TaxID=101364 RepID=UPI002278D588|nr:hepatocyte cell adhesion molecule isoform X3 [Carassius gibelio]